MQLSFTGIGDPLMLFQQVDVLTTYTGQLFLVACGVCIALLIVISSLYRNVDKRKKKLEELIPKKRSLEEEVARLKKRISELDRRNTELEEMDGSKNKLFSVFSHDLRQPISQIRSVLDLLEEQELSGEERKYIVGQLKESVDNSGNALENLLLWSKNQLTGITTEEELVNVLKYVNNLEMRIRSILRSKQLELQIDVPKSFEIRADLNQFEICLRNLVSNALKFSNKGDTISIKVSEDEEFKYIKVEDEGVGMDSDQLEKLLQIKESFTTIGTMNEKGTGLGVRITHEFMQNHCGKLLIESKRGEGSTFTLAFPTTREGQRSSLPK